MDQQKRIENNSFFETYKLQFNAAINLLAGAAGGTSCTLVGQPLDTIKVKLQTHPHLYKNSFTCFRKILLNDGIKGLYAGTVPSLAANIAENSVLFAAYGLSQNAVQIMQNKKNIEELSVLENAFSGSMASTVSSVTLCPTELIKCQLQASRPSPSSDKCAPKQTIIGPWKLTKNIVKENGFSGLYTGFRATLARGMAGYFMFFGAYECTKEALIPKSGAKDDVGFFGHCLAGGNGGIALWVTVYPIDVLKSRIQASHINVSMLKLAKEIIKIEGPGSLYKGLGPTLLRTYPACAVMLATIEYSKKSFAYIIKT